MVFDVAPLTGMSLLENVYITLIFEPMTFKPNQFMVGVYYVFVEVLARTFQPVSGSGVLSSQDFYGHRCLTLTSEPMTLKMSPVSCE